MVTRVSYHPTFGQFADNYLSTYYSGGVATLRRVAGGPVLMLAGTILVVQVFARLASWWLRIPLTLVGMAIALVGLSYTLGPLFNVFLVWLRREQLFGAQRPPTTLEIKGEELYIDQSGEKLNLPFAQIKSIQHRKDSTWLLTQRDSMIYIPKQGLIEGNHDAFLGLLEEAIARRDNTEHR